MKRIVLLLLVLTTKLIGSPISTEEHRQLLVVITPEWESSGGFLARLERDDVAVWHMVGEKIDVVVGKNGLAWGLGLHNEKALIGPVKREGDWKAPAGLFSLSRGFGREDAKFVQSLSFEYTSLQPDTEAVDDPSSRFYNLIVNRSTVADPDWISSEMMHTIPLYELGFCIDHNYPNVEPGRGSAIFFHIWRSPSSPTAGCTATSKENLAMLLAWLDSAKKPLVVQLPAKIYAELRESWLLPEVYTS